MTQKEKAKKLGQKYFPDSANIWARGNFEAHAVESACLEMYEWTRQNLLKVLTRELTKKIKKICL